MYTKNDNNIIIEQITSWEKKIQKIMIIIIIREELHRYILCKNALGGGEKNVYRYNPFKKNCVEIVFFIFIFLFLYVRRDLKYR